MLDNYKAKHSSALVLGNSPPDMLSIYQTYYQAKQISKHQLPQATIKELRSSHFNLGKGQVAYTRQSDTYAKHPLIDKNDFKIPHYQSGTWMAKDAKFQASTTHHRQLPKRQTKPYQKIQPTNRGGFTLGIQGNNYASEFTRSYTQKQSTGNTYTLDNLHPKGNIVIGIDKPSYQTEQKANYKNFKSQKVNGDNSSKYKDNVNIGGQTQHDTYISVYQDQYRKDYQNKSKLFHKDG